MKSEKISYFGLIFWFHLTLIIFANLSPILFSWPLISVGAVVLIIQFLV